MMKSEFERLAMRNDAEIGWEMWRSVERFYDSDNDYHMMVGGASETKQDFVKRVFGGKVNTPRTIARKLAEESIRDNRYCLRGNPSVTEERLLHMDDMIREHYDAMLKYGM